MSPRSGHSKWQRVGKYLLDPHELLSDALFGAHRAVLGEHLGGGGVGRSRGRYALGEEDQELDVLFGYSDSDRWSKTANVNLLTGPFHGRHFQYVN